MSYPIGRVGFEPRFRGSRPRVLSVERTPQWFDVFGSVPAYVATPSCRRAGRTAWALNAAGWRETNPTCPRTRNPLRVRCSRRRRRCSKRPQCERVSADLGPCQTSISDSSSTAARRRRSFGYPLDVQGERGSPAQRRITGASAFHPAVAIGTRGPLRLLTRPSLGRHHRSLRAPTGSPLLW